MTTFHWTHESNSLRINYIINTLKARKAVLLLFLNPVFEEVITMRTKENPIA